MIQLDMRNQDPGQTIEDVKKAMLQASSGMEMEIISDNMEAFDELKDYIGSLHIGFREIYKEEKLIMQFKVPVKVDANP